MTDFIWAGAFCTASSIAFSSRSMRSAAALPRSGSPATSPPGRRARSAPCSASSSIFPSMSSSPPEAAGRVAKELAQSVLRSQFVFLRRLPGAHHVSERFVRRVGHPHRRQVAGCGSCAPASRRLAGPSSPGLPPLPAPASAPPPRTSHPAGQLPVQRVPRRARLVAHPQRRRRLQSLHQLPDRLRPVGDRPQRAASPRPSQTATAIVSA